MGANNKPLFKIELRTYFDRSQSCLTEEISLNDPTVHYYHSQTTFDQWKKQYETDYAKYTLGAKTAGQKYSYEVWCYQFDYKLNDWKKI